MNSSETINELATALAKAQAVMTGALKDSANPFFKSRYADLESVWSACRKALTDNGLSVIQYGAHAALPRDEPNLSPVLFTRLCHSSGQWIEGIFPIRAKDDSPQAMGSAITYARRYGLAAMVGVYQTDDDAEAAQGRHSPHPDTSSVPNEKAERYATAFRECLRSKNDLGVFQTHNDLHDEGEEAYSAAWKLLDAPDRAKLKAIIAAQKQAHERETAATAKALSF